MDTDVSDALPVGKEMICEYTVTQAVSEVMLYGLETVNIRDVRNASTPCGEGTYGAIIIAVCMDKINGVLHDRPCEEGSEL